MLQSFVHKVAKNAFCLVGADRIPRPERADSDSKDIAALLNSNKFKEALLRASKHPEPRIRGRYKELGEILAGEPLRRPHFEMTEDPRTPTSSIWIRRVITMSRSTRIAEPRSCATPT